MNKKSIQATALLRPYEAPSIEMLETQVEQIICGVSVRPNPGSQEEDWDPDEDVDGGECEFE